MSQVFKPINNESLARTGVTGEPTQDNWQELIQRKREMEKNKHKHRLSEADCNLLITKANEFTFTNGQIIANEGEDIPSVYRIKEGSVSLVSGGKKLCTLSQGWFFGETLLINGKCNVFNASIVAEGNVTLYELNLPFVRRLFEVDHLLALKFYRHLATKLSSVFYALVGHVLGSCLMERLPHIPLSRPPPSPLLPQGPLPHSPTLPAPPSSLPSSSASSSRTSSSASSSSSLPRSTSPTNSSLVPRSTSPTPSSPTPSSSLTLSPTPFSPILYESKEMPSLGPILTQLPNLADAFYMEVFNRGRKIGKGRRKSMGNLHLAFKEYPLEGKNKSMRQCILKSNKINIISEAFGFKHKDTIEFSKITNVVKTSDKSITIIYSPMKAKTLFFKKPEDAGEFFGITMSIVGANGQTVQKTAHGNPLSHPHITASLSAPVLPSLSPLPSPSSPALPANKSSPSLKPSLTFSPPPAKPLTFSPTTFGPNTFGPQTFSAPSLPTLPPSLATFAQSKQDTSSNASTASASSSADQADPRAALRSFMDEIDSPEDEAILRSISTLRELKQGEYLFEEGDLYQRIFTILDGEVQVIGKGRVIKVLGSGEIIGVPSILHLRPCPCGMMVSSPTAKISIVPAYRINDLVNSNTTLAARLYKRAAWRIQLQIEHTLLQVNLDYLTQIAAEKSSKTLSTSPSASSLSSNSSTTSSHSA